MGKKTNVLSTKTAMIRPPPPSGPPPPRRTQIRRPVNRPPPPKRPKTSSSPLKNKPAPPPLRSNISPLPPKTRITSHFCLKKRPISIKKPVVLRDVTVFERRQQVGQGTYGSVFMGAYKDTGEVVALKRINTEQEENGFPITAIREVKILKALNHPNIVKLKEIVTSKEQNDSPKSVYLVFEYHEFDLTGILGTREIRLTQDHIKSWSMQLLQGVHYMHVNKIIHRDLKAANILIGRNGELKIADWGLARTWNEKMEKLTNPVITLWYRPPELLLGCKKYSLKIDMWSVGCIIAEMFRRTGLLTGTNDASQLDLIFKTLGHPTVGDFPEIHELCPQWTKLQPKNEESTLKCRLRETLKQNLPNPRWVTENAITLIQNLLAYNPAKRWSVMKACQKAERHFQQRKLNGGGVVNGSRPVVNNKKPKPP